MARRQRRPFGHVRKLPSGRYQASYIGPDGVRHYPDHAHGTFTSIQTAEAWLKVQAGLIETRSWRPPAPRAAVTDTFAAYAQTWLSNRLTRTGEPLKPNSVKQYRWLLETHLIPRWGDLTLGSISREAVESWWRTMPTRKAGKATADPLPRKTRTRVYALLHVILSSAVAEGLIEHNPCAVKGGTNTARTIEIDPASPAEIEALAAAMPDRLALLVLLGGWHALRRGELLELRRGDVDLKANVIRIRRAVSYVDGIQHHHAPKSRAGIRNVTLAPHLHDVVRNHLAANVGTGPDALLFTDPAGKQLTPAKLDYRWRLARKAVGWTGRMHDLRHTGATMLAVVGATTKELMAAIGHDSPNMSMHYQHVTSGRMADLAAKLSGLAAPTAATVTDLAKKRPA